MTNINWSTVDAILMLEPENHQVIDFLITCIQDCVESKKYNFRNQTDARERLQNIGKTNHSNRHLQK